MGNGSTLVIITFYWVGSGGTSQCLKELRYFCTRVFGMGPFGGLLLMEYIPSFLDVLRSYAIE